MRLFLKIAVYCLILTFVYQSNLKRGSTQPMKQIWSNYITSSNFNTTKKILLNQKHFPEKDIELSYYNILFSEVGDKTFICITLLFYQTKIVYLIFTSLFSKFIFIYLKFIISEYNLFQTIPAEIFLVTAIMMYNIIGFYILFKLMFANINENKEECSKVKKTEESEKNFIFEFEEFIKIFGIVIITQITQYSMIQNSKFPFGNFGLQSNEMFKINLTWNNLAINFASIIFGILFSVLIGSITYKKFSLEFNLFFSAITFLLLGIDDSVKFFSVFNEWRIEN